ncbi:hypothetical protein [Actinoplanes sp. L3-i22]|nr:hypothetical protein [Actinoplanes sp. L3-i22]
MTTVPGAADLVPNTSTDCPGWDLRVALPGVVPAPRAAVGQPRAARPEPA